MLRNGLSEASHTSTVPTMLEEDVVIAIFKRMRAFLVPKFSVGCVLGEFSIEARLVFSGNKADSRGKAGALGCCRRQGACF